MYAKCKECLSFDDCKVKNREHPDCSRCSHYRVCHMATMDMCYCCHYDRVYSDEEIEEYRRSMYPICDKFR